MKKLTLSLLLVALFFSLTSQVAAESYTFSAAQVQQEYQAKLDC